MLKIIYHMSKTLLTIINQEKNLQKLFLYVKMTDII